MTLTWEFRKLNNKAVALAQNLGVFWLYFFDDDAQFDPRWISIAKESWQELKAHKTPVGILLAPIVTNDSAYLDSRIGLKGNYSTIASVITSGIFTNVDVFNHSGGYNPDFFVDWADLEFTRRVKQSGNLVIRLNIVLVFQAFGRSLDNHNLRNKLINTYIKSSSLLSLRLNKSNTLSTLFCVFAFTLQQSKDKCIMVNEAFRNKEFGIPIVSDFGSPYSPAQNLKKGNIDFL